MSLVSDALQNVLSIRTDPSATLRSAGASFTASARLAMELDAVIEKKKQREIDQLNRTQDRMYELEDTIYRQEFAIADREDRQRQQWAIQGSSQAHARNMQARSQEHSRSMQYAGFQNSVKLENLRAKNRSKAVSTRVKQSPRNTVRENINNVNNLVIQ